MQPMQPVTIKGYNDDAEEIPAYVAVDHLCATTTFAARFALGQGIDRATVASVLEDLANAIRNPGDVAESTEPITLDDLAAH
jgi:hypothetical protein